MLFKLAAQGARTLLMSAQPDRSHTAQIVDMVRLLDPSSRRRDISPTGSRGTAVLLSIRQSLRYQAAIGPDDIDTLEAGLPANQLDALLAQVRGLLHAEFGRLRVYRYRQVFSVGHYHLEGLIGGLLRVQYHARQIQLPAGVCGLDTAVRPGLTLSWGVGSTVLEADNERLRRRSRR